MKKQELKKYDEVPVGLPPYALPPLTTLYRQHTTSVEGALNTIRKAAGEWLINYGPAACNLVAFGQELPFSDEEIRDTIAATFSDMEATLAGIKGSEDLERREQLEAMLSMAIQGLPRLHIQRSINLKGRVAVGYQPT